VHPDLSDQRSIAPTTLMLDHHGTQYVWVWSIGFAERSILIYTARSVCSLGT